MPSVECVCGCAGVWTFVSLCNESLGKAASLFPRRMSFSRGGEWDEPAKRRGEKLRSGPERKGGEKGAADRFTLPARLLWEGLKQLFG